MRPTAAKVPAARWPPTTALSTLSMRSAAVLHCFCGIWVLWPELWCAEHVQPEPIRLGQQRQWGDRGGGMHEGRRQTCVFYIWIWSHPTPERWLAIEIWLGNPEPFVLIETLLCWSRGERRQAAPFQFHCKSEATASSFSHFQLQLSLFKQSNKEKNYWNEAIQLFFTLHGSI